MYGMGVHELEEVKYAGPNTLDSLIGLLKNEITKALPSVTATDAGRFLGVSDDGTWGVQNNPLHEGSTQSGEAVSCYSAVGNTFRVVSDIELNQPGTGKPSPDNIRPISGWDAVNLMVNDDTYTVQFGRTVYEGTYDWTEGRLTTENYALLTLTGDEDFSAADAGRNGNTQVYTLTDRGIGTLGAWATQRGKGASNMFKALTEPSVSFASLSKNTYYWVESTGAWRFGWGEPGSTVEEFKAFLQANPLQILVPITPATSTYIFDIQTIYAHDGVNNIQSDTGNTTVEVDAPIKVIGSLVSKINELESRISELQDMILTEGLHKVASVEEVQDV